MANETKNAGKSLTRSDAMKRAWESRRAKSNAETAWFQNPSAYAVAARRWPGTRTRRSSGSSSSAMMPRLKSVAAGMLAGEVPAHAIPEIARVLKSRIGFLRARPELAKAF